MNKKLIITIAIIVTTFLLITGSSLYILIDQYNQKKEGNVYIVILRYPIVDGKMIDSNPEVILDELFTDELKYHETIRTGEGFNEILIENGVAKVVASNCKHPHGFNGCQSKELRNKNFSLLNSDIISCISHGIVMKIEVRDENRI